MNSTQHIIALKPEHISLLTALSRTVLIAGVHSGLTSGMNAQLATQYVVAQVDAHNYLIDLIRWRSEDSGRAYRTLAKPMIVEMIALLQDVVLELLDEKERALYLTYGPELEAQLLSAMERPAVIRKFMDVGAVA
jgi:hypothetical protein